MTSKRFMLCAACYLLLIKKDKILLLRRFNTGWEDGKYTLISGHLEASEAVVDLDVVHAIFSEFLALDKSYT